MKGGEGAPQGLIRPLGALGPYEVLKGLITPFFAFLALFEAL